MASFVSLSSRAAFAIWATVVFVGGASLMASHLVALPTPAVVDPLVLAEIARDPASKGRWSLVHVLAARCGCSRAVVEHIVRRGPLAGVHERILWVTGDGLAPPAAASTAFALDVLTSSALTERLGVIGAPTLLVASADGHVQYIGGYTRQKQSPVIVDVDVLTRLRRGERVDPLPVLGCALDKKTARRLDPLGIR